MHNQVARTLRIVVYTLLLASTAVANFFHERPHKLWGAGAVPSWAPYVAPVSFGLFIVVFGLDRLFAVRRQHYATTRALMQVATALLLLTLLLPTRPPEPRPSPADAPPGLPPLDGASGPWPAQLLLQYEDAAVRQATCELLAGEALGVPHPLPPGHPLEALRDLLAELSEDDPVGEVREACARALGQLAPMADADPDGGGPAARPEAPRGADDDDDDDEDDEDEDGGGNAPWAHDGGVSETL